MQQALAATDWDYIVFQQASGNAGDADTYDSLSTLMSYVKQYAPNAKLLFDVNLPEDNQVRRFL